MHPSAYIWFFRTLFRCTGLFILCLSANAQTQRPIQILPERAEKIILNLQAQAPQWYAPNDSLQKNLQKLLQKLHRHGYLEARIDSIIRSDSLLTLHFKIGNQYQWAFINNGNIKTRILEKAGYRKGLFEQTPVQIEHIRHLQQRILQQYENAGYPFARIYLDSIRIAENKVAASLFVQKHRPIEMGELKVQGSINISKRFLAQYLGLEPGTPYNRSRILNIRNRLGELPYVTETNPPVINFIGGKAHVQLFLKKEQASRFDFIIGVSPKNEELDRLLVTGTFTGEMYNQFGLGERLYAAYEQLRPDTREINLAFNYPYILNLPFGTALQFDLYRRDSSYLDVIFNAGIQYLLEEGRYFEVFYRQANSNLLQPDTTTIIRQKQLPPALDVKNTGLGLRYNWQQLNYRNNPRKGYALQISASAGLKTIERNSRITGLTDPDQPGFDFRQLYDSLELQAYQLRVLLQGACYLPVLSNQTLKLAVQSGVVISKSPVFFNEQYRIGGNRLLRGFDEESIFASRYTVLTAEYRLLTGQDSYVFAFADGAWVADVTNTRATTDFPLGFGAGITFDTKVGIFGLSYALGRRQGNAIDFSSGKIHFGYVSLF